MKKFMAIFFTILFFSTFLFAGKVISIGDSEDFNSSVILLAFPEKIDNTKIEHFKSILKIMGANQFYNLNKQKPEKLNKFVYCFLIYGFKDMDYLKKNLELPENSEFTQKRIVFSICNAQGDNLTGVFRTQNGIIYVSSSLSNFDRYFFNTPRIQQCSYYVFNCGQVIDTGVYDRDYSFVNCEIPVYFAIKDLEFFFKAVKDIHPALLSKLRLHNYLDLKINSYKEITDKTKNGYIKIKDLLKVVSESAASFGDGHTSVWDYYRPTNNNSADCGFPPFLLDAHNGKFFITSVLSDKVSKKYIGAEVLSINGKNVWDVYEPIFDLCSAKSRFFKAARFIKKQGFYYSLSEVFKKNEMLNVKTTKGEFKVKCIDANTFMKIPVNRVKFEKKIITGFFQNGKIGYFYLPEFDFNNDFMSKIDNFFDEVKEKKCKAIIIDIRDNPGGNSQLGEYIICHLTKRPYTAFSKVDMKYSPEVLKLYFPVLSHEIDLNGTIVEFNDTSLYRSFNFPNVFKGKVYLLINEGVFSSATDFAAIMQDFKLATLIGYETGGLPTSFGDVCFQKLPFSSIEFGVSWKKFYRPKYTPDNADRGVIPDVPLNEEKLKPYKNDKDPFLSFVLDYVKRDLKK